MKKLRIKVFLVIMLILSSFVITTTIFINYKSYFEYDKSIKDIFIRMDLNKKSPPNNRNIFINYNVYTIMLDDDGNFKELINHTVNDIINEDEIKEIATNIITNHKKDIFIGCLYFNKYSYKFTNNNSLIIVDNTEKNISLTSQLYVSLIIFVVLEVIIYLISYYLTKWITLPVEKSFESQKRFIGDASHELKTPLAVIMASTDAYMEDNDIKWLNNIKEESDRMNKLVTSLLDLTRLESVKEVDMKEENISDIIEGMALTLESLFYEKNIKLDYHIEENILMKCNIDEIKKLISILLDNAIKHTKKDGKVLVNLKVISKDIILTVKNQGTPIKKGDEEKIFERFYRGDSSHNRNSNSYGLGLSIAKNIVTNHNGEIKASSTEDYTTFKIRWNKK